MIEAVLSRAPVDAVPRLTRSDINALSVHSRCSCGCASIGFLPESQSAPTTVRRLADGLGLTADAQEVGVLLYGTEDTLVELEVYWHETAPAPLPAPETIIPFGTRRPTS